MNNMKNQILNFWNCLIVFSLASSFGLYFQFSKQMSAFSGEDSFYHVGMAKYIVSHGITDRFPYLYFTNLHEHYVNHHLLFHLFLIPFIKVFGEINGPKIFISIIFGLIFVFIYLIFKHFKIRVGLFYAICLIFLMPCDFYFRMNFIRDPAPSLLFMIISYYLILVRKPLALFILSFAFSWLYGGFFFIPILVLFYLISQILLKEKLDLKIATYSLLGSTLGLIINPYFPANISFLYSQIFLTGLGAKPYSGGEWRSYEAFYWLKISIVPIIIFCSSILVLSLKNTKISSKVLSAFMFGLLLLFLQMKSQRFVEYWPLWAGMTGIIIFGQDLYQYFINLLYKNNLVKLMIVTVFVAAGAMGLIIKSAHEITKAKGDTATPIDYSETKNVMEYVSNHSNDGEIIFTDDWDVFPFYFYFNQKNYYLVGLDPEFMNQYDPKLYKEYASISSGHDANKLERIKNDFKASWVIIGSDHQQFYYNLSAYPQLFEKVFESPNYWLFRVK